MHDSKKRNDTFIIGVDLFMNVVQLYIRNNLRTGGYVFACALIAKTKKRGLMLSRFMYHLLHRDFMGNYHIWNKHGEVGDNESSHVDGATIQGNIGLTVPDMSKSSNQ